MSAPHEVTTDLTVPSPAPPAPPGALDVPGYTELVEIGRGGMGTVYRARDPQFERAVAIKVMRPGQDAGRFAAEARITAQLPHPGVPPVHALGALADGTPYLVMKLVEGRTLSADGACAPARAAGLFERVCETVALAHSRGIVHRDLKPANIMVGAFGEVLVMDWGLAKELGAPYADAPDADSVPGATQLGSVKGTPAFMAPEQARGEPIDTRADVFALGGVLAALLTGQPVFEGDTAWKTVELARAGAIDAAFARLDACGADAELVALAKRCLAPNPAERFADAGAVAASVAALRAEADERVRAAERERAASAAEAREQRKRRKVQLGLVAALAVLVAGGGAVAWREERRARVAEREAAEFEAAERFRAERARGATTAALATAAELRTRYEFDAAERLLEQADRSAAGHADLEHATADARRELRFVVNIDRARYKRYAGVAPGLMRPETVGGDIADAFRAAFAEFGLAPATADPAALGPTVARSAIRTELIAALEYWAAFEPNREVRARLLHALRVADPGPWTDRFRDPAVRDDPDALAELAREVACASERPAVLLALALAQFRHGVTNEPLLARARVAHPRDFELAFAHGGVLLLGGDRARAVGPLSVAFGVRPDSRPALVTFAAAAAAAGDRAGAIAALNRVLEGGSDAVARAALAGLYEMTGDVAAAVAEHTAALRLDPNDRAALGAVARLTARPGQPVPVLTRETYLDRGFARGEAGALDEAAVLYRAALLLDPQYALALNNLSNVYRARGDAATAVRIARAAVRADPNLHFAHASLAFALRDSGDRAAARESMETAARLDARWRAEAGALALPVAPPPRAR